MQGVNKFLTKFDTDGRRAGVIYCVDMSISTLKMSIFYKYKKHATWHPPASSRLCIVSDMGTFMWHLMKKFCIQYIPHS